MLKTIAKQVLRQLFPKQYCRMKMRRMLSQQLEPEIDILPLLADPRHPSVDIGAHAGVYTAHLLRHSSEVVAFEPVHKASDFLDLARVLKCPVRWHRLALSDHHGFALMRVPSESDGLATIHPANSLAYATALHISEVQVPVARLDDFGLPRVGLIKIDVEGHETAVLRGAAETIRRTRCNLIVECEDRHSVGAVDNLFRWMKQHSYNGYFLTEGRMYSTADFRLDAHQNTAHLGDWRNNWKRSGTYVNNFIFVPEENTERYERAACSWLSATTS